MSRCCLEQLEHIVLNLIVDLHSTREVVDSMSRLGFSSSIINVVQLLSKLFPSMFFIQDRFEFSFRR